MIHHKATDIHSKRPMNSGLLGQGIAIESEDSLFKTN